MIPQEECQEPTLAFAGELTLTPVSFAENLMLKLGWSWTSEYLMTTSEERVREARPLTLGLVSCRSSQGQPQVQPPPHRLARQGQPGQGRVCHQAGDHLDIHNIRLAKKEPVHYILNTVFCCFSCIIAMVPKKSPTVEIKGDQIEWESGGGTIRNRMNHFGGSIRNRP